ncbi:2-octaprenyl-6-methoxyphenyl hydroxylase [Pleionea sp. CnH1-48]|uniref:2-octaprenyl-6-methoxyphenyl hydroxylase n=1 Tax=Pleionea sp. CnH1-48 TaxID=2954494 RepID=UPI0020969E19|nr:2-octaprenyl-6-methoxyphenyl hydroxylase [Pleionea sp. CnH1-48]MCO7226224.1 2-octaprenyl-6-methoxyphenyl hydroxylase [Pleionea sp. CnH1-48]
MQSHYDVVIIGGGMVGASMALALSVLPLSIAVVEAFPPQGQQQPSFDDRSVALSSGSVRILQTMGCWDALQPGCAAIEHIHISERGQAGLCRLHASDYDLKALGYVVENRFAGEVFYQRIARQPQIELISPAKLISIQQDAHQVTLGLETADGHKKLSAHLMVAADGTQSNSAQLLDLVYQQTQYEPMALISNIATSVPHKNWAFERFTPFGPLALLPLTRNRMSLVWSIDAADKESLLSMSDKEVCAQLQQSFGYRLGKIQRIGQRHIYPLSLKQLQQGVVGRVVFVGNALHTTHPVAGQGFNLGLRDVAALAEYIAKAHYQNLDIGAQAHLQAYWQSRQPDIQQTLAATHSLAVGFSHRHPLAIALRNAALKGLDIFSPAKSLFAQQAMGLRHDLPLLARGVPLERIQQKTKGVAYG